MKALVITALTLLLASCATAPISDFKYAEAEEHIFENELLVDQPFDAVWDELVGELATTFYVINNIDKESRLLNVSFSESNKPSIFIDCGSTSRTFELNGNKENFNYLVADSSTYKLTSGKVNGANTWYYINERDTDLSGRANIYVAPSEDGASTKITVNARYILSLTVDAQEINFHAPSNSHFTIGRPQQVHDEMIAFNSMTVGTSSDGVTCVSNGRFENDVLAILK